MKADPKTTSGRAFVRSLNILLKFARLYGYEHARTIEQLQIAWQELRAAIPLGTEAGLLLGATNSQLLLDGVPLEGSPAEKQRSEEHTSELQSRSDLVCRLLLEKKKKIKYYK